MNICKHGNLHPAWLVGVLILLNATLAVAPVYATTIQFTGTLGVVEIDNGSSRYSGSTIGNSFSGRFTYGNNASDVTFVEIIAPTATDYHFTGTPHGGFITDGSTVTAGAESVVNIENNDGVGEDAVFLNNLFGAGSVTASDIVDSWGVESSSEVAPNRFLFFGIVLQSLDTSLFSTTDFQVLPPALADSDFPLFFIGEEDEFGNDIYSATGQLTSITVVPDPATACGTLLTTNTTLDSDMVCPFNAFILNGAGSNNVTLNCAGFSVANTGTNSPAIAASNVSGIVIRNCNINTHGNQAYGISMSNVSSSVILDNIITTDKTFSHGINMSQSFNNLIDGNTISTTGLSARGMQIQNLSSFNTLSGNSMTSALSLGVRLRAGSDNNTFSQNSVESGTSYAVDIQSASDNLFDGNTLISPSSFLRQRNLSVQNGGLSVDSAGNIFAVENNFGSNGGSGGAVATLIQVDPNTGDPLSYVRLVSGGFDLGFGFDSLEIMPDGRFLAGRGGNQNSIYEINPVSGEVSLLSAITSIGGFNGLQSAGINTLLATTNQGDLLSIDLVTNMGTSLGQDGNGWTDLAMHPTSGKLYTTSRWSLEPSGTSHLYEIDPANGLIVQEIGDTGQSILSDIDFSASGVLYGNNGLVVIDTTTGAGTYLGGFGPDPFEPLSQNNTLTNQTFSATSTSVQFSQPINLPDSVNLKLNTNAIQLGQNRIFVESTLFPFLDMPARITFENLAGTSRDLLVDPEDDGSFVPCLSPQCTPVSFTGGTLIFDVAGFTTYSSSVIGTTTSVVASVLPVSRSVPVATTATAFASIINFGANPATGCSIEPLTSIPATFSYQTTDPATNAVTGTPDTPEDIAAGATQTFVFAITPTAPIAPTDVEMTFKCLNTAPAPIYAGSAVNTLLFSASATPIPDVIAQGATVGNTGIVDIPGNNGNSLFAAGTSNVGVTGDITVSADTGNASLPLVLNVCETDPGSGACISTIQPTLTVTYGGASNRSFAIFVSGTGNVPFDPANNRVIVRFKDSGGVTRGATSVAIRTQ